MRAAAAEVRFHVLADLCFAGVRIRFEQGLRTHDHAGDAIAALRGLVIDECLLKCPGFFWRAKTFEGAHRALADGCNGQDARERWFSVDQHGAGTTLAKPAAELRTVQGEVIAQRIEQGRCGIDIQRVAGPIDGEFDHCSSIPLRIALAVSTRSRQGAPRVYVALR